MFSFSYIFICFCVFTLKVHIIHSLDCWAREKISFIHIIEIAPEIHKSKKSHALQFIRFIAARGSYSLYELSAKVHEFPWIWICISMKMTWILIVISRIWNKNKGIVLFLLLWIFGAISITLIVQIKTTANKDDVLMIGSF